MAAFNAILEIERGKSSIVIANFIMAAFNAILEIELGKSSINVAHFIMAAFNAILERAGKKQHQCSTLHVKSSL